MKDETRPLGPLGHMTPLHLSDDEQIVYLPIGTIVYGWYFDHYGENILAARYKVKVERRENTNYDNQRRAVSIETGQHLFWVNGN